MDNPWIVKAAAKGYVPLPAGSYLARFVKVEEIVVSRYTEKSNKRWRWAWEVLTGEFKGKTISALTSISITPDTNAGKYIPGLIGKPLKDGDDVEGLVNACIGGTYLVVVGVNPKSEAGSLTVTSVSKPPEGM